MALHFPHRGLGSREAPPYVSTSPAPPGGGLHIHRVDDFLEVSFSYAVFDGTATPDVRIVPVKPHRVRLVEFKDWLCGSVQGDEASTPAWDHLLYFSVFFLRSVVAHASHFLFCQERAKQALERWWPGARGSRSAN